MTAYLVRYHGVTADGRVFPTVETVVGVDSGHRGIQAELVTTIARSLAERCRPLGWEWAEIDEVKHLGSLLILVV